MWVYKLSRKIRSWDSVGQKGVSTYWPKSLWQRKMKKDEKRSIMAKAEKAYNHACHLVFKKKRSKEEALIWLDLP